MARLAGGRHHTDLRISMLEALRICGLFKQVREFVVAAVAGVFRIQQLHGCTGKAWHKGWQRWVSSSRCSYGLLLELLRQYAPLGEGQPVSHLSPAIKARHISCGADEFKTDGQLQQIRRIADRQPIHKVRVFIPIFPHTLPTQREPNAVFSFSNYQRASAQSAVWKTRAGKFLP